MRGGTIKSTRGVDLFLSLVEPAGGEPAARSAVEEVGASSDEPSGISLESGGLSTQGKGQRRSKEEEEEGEGRKVELTKQDDPVGEERKLLKTPGG